MVNKNLFSAQVAQYKIGEASGEESVEFEKGIECYFPEIDIKGNVYQEETTYNRLDEELLISPISGTVTVGYSNGEKFYALGPNPDFSGAFIAIYEGEIVDKIKTGLLAGTLGLVIRPTTADMGSFTLLFLTETNTQVAQLRISSNVAAGYSYMTKGRFSDDYINNFKRIAISASTKIKLQNMMLVSENDHDISTIPEYKPYSRKNVNSEKKIAYPGYTRLPKEYRETTYIQTNSRTVGINTEVVANENTRVYCRFATLAGSTNYIFGAGLNTGRNTCYVSYNSNVWNLRFGATATYTLTGTTNDFKMHTVDISKNGLFFDGDLKYTEDITEFTTDVPIYALAVNLNGKITPGSARIYDMKIYDGNELIRDFIPCYRCSDNLLGFYDLVTKAFYGFTTKSSTQKPGDLVGVKIDVRGRNLLNAKTYKSVDTNGVTCVSENNIFKITGTATANTVAGIRGTTSVNLKVGTKYTTRITRLSGKLTGGADVRLYIFKVNHPTNGSITYTKTAGMISGSTNEVINTVTVSSTDMTEYGATIGVYSALKKDVDFDCEYRIEFVEGEYTSATFPPYEEYSTGTNVNFATNEKLPDRNLALTFAKCGTYTDELILDGLNRKVKYIQRVNKIKLTGDEPGWYSWASSSLGQPIACPGSNIVTGEFLPKNHTGSKIGIVCNYLNELNPTAADIENIGICYFNYIPGNNYWWAINLGEPDLESVKAKLRSYVEKGKPLEVLYPLETPIEHDISDTTTGKALLNLIQQNNTSVITINNSEELKQALSVKYLTHA